MGLWGWGGSFPPLFFFLWLLCPFVQNNGLGVLQYTAWCRRKKRGGRKRMSAEEKKGGPSSVYGSPPPLLSPPAISGMPIMTKWPTRRRRRRLRMVARCRDEIGGEKYSAYSTYIPQVREERVLFLYVNLQQLYTYVWLYSTRSPHTFFMSNNCILRVSDTGECPSCLSLSSHSRVSSPIPLFAASARGERNEPLLLPSLPPSSSVASS